MKRTIMAITLATVALTAAAQAVPFSNLGDALYAKGYTGSVWVNSFSSPSLYLAHGDFHPSVPGYEPRYGMLIDPASGTVADNPSGGSDAQGTATNSNSSPSDGSILIQLVQSGVVHEEALIDFLGCAPGQACPWSTHFLTTLTGSGWTVTVRRQVKGSRCGGELNFDFNSTCHDKLTTLFDLPADYFFTAQDLYDADYVSKPGGLTTALCAEIKPLCDAVPAPVPVSDFTWQPTAIHPGDLVSFADSSTGAPSAWSWSFQSGSPSSATTANPQVRFSTPGQKTVTLAASNASGTGTLATRVVTVIDPNPTGGELAFTVSPPSPTTDQVVVFDASPSTFLPLGSVYSWDFSDGSPTASGVTVLHAFVQAGTYNVALTVTPPGCLSLTCLPSKTKAVTVSPSLPPVSADFTTDASCQTEGGADSCQASSGQTVALIAVETAATAYSWNFGDGTAPTHGQSVSHSWANAGSFLVTLTVTKDTRAAIKSRTFVVVAQKKTVLLPWVFDGLAPLLQSNDLYVYNPGAATLAVTLEFRKRGTPDVNPPRRTVAIAPHATAYLPDALSLFGRPGQSGFVNVIVDSTAVSPIVTALDTTARKTGQIFALAVPGASLPSGTAPAIGSSAQHLVGLNDTTERQSIVGVSNPASQTATYHLRFFDKTGTALGQSSDLNLAPYRQAQFGIQALRNSFGVTSEADYRVVVEGVDGPAVHPFASDVRLATGDISLTVPEPQPTAKSYLLGVVNGGGLAGPSLVTDLLLANVGDETVTTTLALTKPGKPRATSPTPVVVEAGQTQRLQNVLLGRFGLKAGTGVLTLTSSSPGPLYPVVLAESFDNSNPAKRYGQTLVAVRDADAALAGAESVLAGLRQDAAYSTTLWLFNPGAVAGRYDLVYRRVDGTVIGTLSNVALPAGGLRQFDPTQHPIKKPYPVGGFIVEVSVKNGRALTAAQVVNLTTHDPAYIVGVKH